MGIIGASFIGDVVEGLANAKSELLCGKPLEESTRDGLPNPVEGIGNGIAGTIDLIGRGVDDLTGMVGDGVKGTLGRIPVIGGVFGLAGDAVKGAGDVASGLVQDGATVVDGLTGIATGIGGGVLGMRTADSAHEARLDGTEVPDDLSEAISSRGLVGGGLEWLTQRGMEMLGLAEAGDDATAMAERPLMTQEQANAYMAREQAMADAGWGRAFDAATPKVAATEDDPYAELYEDQAGLSL